MTSEKQAAVVMKKSGRSLTLAVGVIAIISIIGTRHATAYQPPLPTVLAKRGALIVDDDGTTERGSKTVIDLGNGIGLKSALGTWKRSTPQSNVWRSTWKPGMGHPPVVSYPGVKARNLIVEVTFRYGEATESWHEQFLRIAADNRPQLKGHIVSAWVNPKGQYTETGMVLEHVGKRDEKTGSRGFVLDHQPIHTEANTWYTAMLEIVDDEALFRMDNHVAYAWADQINTAKNLVSLTLGTTWHEIKRVRIWHAEPNTGWKANKSTILKSRKPFTIRRR